MSLVSDACFTSVDLDIYTGAISLTTVDTVSEEHATLKSTPLFERVYDEDTQSSYYCLNEKLLPKDVKDNPPTALYLHNP
jgi:hypothetical protein